MFGFPVPIVHWLVEYGIGFVIISLLVRGFASWFGFDERYSIIRFLARVTDPFMTPVRRIVRPALSTSIRVDLTFIFVIFLLSTLDTLLAQSLPQPW